MRPQRPCIEPTCGALHRNPGPRCGPHERAHQQARNKRRTQYQGTWQATSKKARAEQPWCSICGKTADEVQLSLDHEYGNVQCVPCNSAHRRDVT